MADIENRAVAGGWVGSSAVAETGQNWMSAARSGLRLAPAGWMSEMIGQSKEFRIELTGSDHNFNTNNLHQWMVDAAGGAWPGANSVWRIIVHSGVQLVSVNTGTACMWFGGAIQGRVIVENYGWIFGRGGGGGYGDNNPGGGEGGGAAIYREGHITLEIINNGVIAGGGGGQGGGVKGGAYGSQSLGGGGGAPFGPGGGSTDGGINGGGASITDPGAGGDGGTGGGLGLNGGGGGGNLAAAGGGPAGYAIGGGGPLALTVQGDMRGPIA